MLKSRGFTIVEILSTITILAIVATIAAPEYWKLRNRDDYRSEGQALFDTLLDARNAALTNKSCGNGNTSVRWLVFFDTDDGFPAYEVRCFWNDTTAYFEEQAEVRMSKSEIELIDFNEAADPAEIDVLAGGTLPDSIEFSFFSGGVTAKLEYDQGVTTTKEESVKIVIGHDTTDYQHTICFNRVSGFPTFNKTGDTCQDY